MSKVPATMQDRRHRRVAWAVTGVASIMLGMSFAAVPLYEAFCRATGYGGTTQVAEKAPTARGERTFTVRFDTNVASNLGWKFEAEVPSVRVQTGEVKTVFFRITNRSTQDTAGVASYNVAPDIAGSWFNKISCFCFEDVLVRAGETVELPVAFFLDPALEKDPSMKAIESVTLSYTFYTSKKKTPVASADVISKPKL